MSRGFPRIGLWRIAALLLLLCGAFDLLAIDTGLWNPSGSAACCDDSLASDDCYCCCAHVVVISPVAVSPANMVAEFVSIAPALPASVPAQVPDLPPRA